MTIGSANKLASAIASQSNDIQTLQSNISPDDPNAVFPLFFNYRLIQSGELIVKKKVYELNALVWDHPVYGDLDVYIWDAGYDDTQDEILYNGAI